MTDKLRVGIIGSGGIAAGVHAPGYKALPADCELVACCDVATRTGQSLCRAL